MRNHTILRVHDCTREYAFFNPYSTEMYKIYYLNFSSNMFFYTLQPFCSADSNRLIIETSVLCTYVTRKHGMEGVVSLIWWWLEQESCTHIISTLFISVEDKETSDAFVGFVIRILVTPLHTHLFIVSSLSTNVTIYKYTFISPGWDLGISLLCGVF